MFGAQVDMSTTRNGFQPLGMSYYRFNSFEDFRNGVKPTDFAITYSLNQDFSQAFPTFKFAQYAAYVQDEITFSRKFRLTLGLRADLNTYPGVEELKTNPLVANLTFEGGTKINTGELPKPKVMFSPRVGFNYDPNGDRSLQIRGGTGIFTGRVPFVWIVGQSGNSGMLQVTQSFTRLALSTKIQELICLLRRRLQEQLFQARLPRLIPTLHCHKPGKQASAWIQGYLAVS
jgi:hypothetical protein